MTEAQFNEVEEITDWCKENKNQLFVSGLNSDQVVNKCKIDLFPNGSKILSDMTITRIVESSFSLQ
jgi:hypothetical protein